MHIIDEIVGNVFTKKKKKTNASKTVLAFFLNSTRRCISVSTRQVYCSDPDWLIYRPEMFALKENVTVVNTKAAATLGRAHEVNSLSPVGSRNREIILNFIVVVF